MNYYFIVETKSLTSDMMHKSQPFETLAEATAEARKIAMRHRRTCRVVRVDVDPNEASWACCFANIEGRDCDCMSDEYHHERQYNDCGCGACYECNYGQTEAEYIHEQIDC